uniref:Uncharacterized protein n=1 Tax=Candidatus Kentrum sp. FW TaxID=2126338 RepID=A0A450SJF8_9GAMM|nr:MAG: hypothetical protein BECKFW1821A_GA0114235_101932 [Candidatus Kentron sp. FW]VFJ53520.1 MAG: hypothetical protein BECKFW1821B_GA0114236_101521 [Candidatus Kentron sp. FW]
MTEEEAKNKANEALDAMRRAVNTALLEKKQNGQYAIFAGKNGESIRVEAKDIKINDIHTRQVKLLA